MELTKFDINKVIRALPEIVITLLKVYNDTSTKPKSWSNVSAYQGAQLEPDPGPRLVLAGGFIRDTISNQRPKDIDLFCADLNIFNKTSESLKQHNYPIIFESRRTLSHETKTFDVHGKEVQVIYGYSRSVNKDGAHDWFDFTVCQASVWYDYEQRPIGRCSDDFYSALAGKRLEYVGDRKTPVLALRRLVRFVSRGYNNADKSLEALLVDIIQQALETPQLSGAITPGFPGLDIAIKVAVNALYHNLETRVPGSQDEYKKLDDDDKIPVRYNGCDS